jgi:hypothetical protein
MTEGRPLSEVIVEVSKSLEGLSTQDARAVLDTVKMSVVRYADNSILKLPYPPSPV